MTTLVSTDLRNSLPDHLENALLPWEDTDAFFELLRSYHQRYVPIGPAETELIETLALLSWKRRRISLAERAAHLAMAKQRSGMERADAVSMRARCAEPSTDRLHTNSYEALKTDEDADLRDKRDIAEDLAMTQNAMRLIQDNGQDAYEQAVEALREDTRNWWVEASVPESGDYEQNAQHLLKFLETDVIPTLINGAKGIDQRPAIRLQIHGESVDPIRLTTLHKLDERLQRQYDQTLRTLERVQSSGRKRSK